MRLKCLFQFFVLFSIPNMGFSKADLANKICGAGFTETSVSYDWRKQRINDQRGEDGHCVEVFCQNSDTQLKRKKCLKQGDHKNVVEIYYQDEVRENNLFRSTGRYHKVMLHEGEECLDACLPEERRILGIKTAPLVGLDRESCLTCFTKREDQGNNTSFLYTGIGKRLYSGQKCYQLCRDPEGEIKTSRTFTPECQKCVGLGNNRPEKFTYLLTKEGRCVEFDSSNVRRSVSNVDLCKTADDLLLTKYKTSKTGNIIFGQKKICQEVDVITNGDLFLRNLDNSHCEKAIVDSDRSIERSDTKRVSPAKSNTSSRASGQ